MHNFPGPAESPYRESAADNFAEARHVRDHPVPLLSPAAREPETRHNLVEDQDYPVLARQFTQAFQITLCRRYTPHVAAYGLQDNRRELLAVGLEKLAHRVEVVVGQDSRIFGGAFRNTRAIGQSKGGYAGPSGDQQGVAMAVVVAVELEYSLTAGVTSGHPYGAHSWLRCRSSSSRTISKDGTAAQINSAISTSSSVGAPKVVPFRAADSIAPVTRWSAWPRMRGP